MRPDTILTAAVAVLLLVSSAIAEEEVVHDHWFAQFQGKDKAGWAHERRVRSEVDGATVVVTESESMMLRGPGGQKLEKPIRSSSRYVEDADGAVLSYATSVDIGMGPQTREGTVKDGVISAKEDGKSRSIPYPAGALGPAGVQRAMTASLKPGAGGKVVSFSALDPATSSPVEWKVPAETKFVDVLGRYGWLFPVERTDSTGIPETLLLDGAGSVWGGALNFGLIRYFRTEEVVAKSDRDPASLVTSRVVAPDRVIPADARRSRTVLRLSRESGAVGDLPASRAQKVVARGEGGSVDVELTMGKTKGDLVVWMRPYIGDDVDAAYLAETPLVEISHARVERPAKSAVGNVVEAFGCARLLELRTKQYVQPAPANVGFASAASVISSRTGDSTETAVLAVGFARALGLPARVVAGFVYRGPEQWPDGAHPRGAFTFHTWAEIYVGEDLWHPVDPMRMDGTQPRKSVRELIGHGGFDATHVAVLRSDLATDRPFTDIVLPVLEFMDGLRVEVLEPKE